MRAFVAALSLSLAATASAQVIRSDYLGGFSSPTGLRFTGHDQGFVIEKGGTVKYFDGNDITTALSLDVASNSERGLLGIALDPAFATNRHVYLYHSTGSGSTGSATWIDNRVSRFTWNPNSKLLEGEQLVRTFGTSANGEPDGANHNGGVLTFGPDGKLYGVTGDLNRNSVEQNNQASNSSAFTGGVFRLNSDGSVPTDGNNKFSGDYAPWYTYGVRNSFGLAVDPVTGNLWNTENGLQTYDEINLVTSGMNSGWRPIQGPLSRNPAGAEASLVTLPGATYQEPKFSFAEAIGITSIQFLHGSVWGEAYDNAVLIGDVVNSGLWLLRLDPVTRERFILEGDLADGVFDSGDSFGPIGTGFGIVTDIQLGDDGQVYVVSLNGNIYRVTPVPEPSKWMLAFAGLGLVGLAVRRKRRQQRK